MVFNEVMYHPAADPAVMEWVELHNQMAVAVDLSGWSIAGGIDYPFADGVTIPGGGYLVVAASPADLMAATGLTNVLGPFTGRLSNGGDTLELRNKNQRLMDRLVYGTDDDWPVGPDGSGVSLAKRDETTASEPAENWTVSALTGGTPARLNFALKPFEVTNTQPIRVDSVWKYDASGANTGTDWREAGFDDSAWPSGQALFQAGTLPPPSGDPQPIPTVFSTGLDAQGAPLPPGSTDPHYRLTRSAQTTPPPPSIPATVVQNHPAWYANDALSMWLGPVNPGTVDVAVGAYDFRTVFSLDGFDPATARLTLNVGADNNLTDVLLNGVSAGISYSGFASLSGSFTITNGFVAGSNTLEFLTVNAGDAPNPAGFRLRMSGVACQQLATHSTLPPGPARCLFRTRFTLDGAPQRAGLRLNTILADGAVFYVNGTEVLRWNMPAGPVDSATVAVTNVTSAAYLGPFALPNSALRTGANVLAVEVHRAAGSTNLLFGADLGLTQTNVLVPETLAVAFNELSAATNAGFQVELINYGLTNVDLGGCVLARRGTTADGAFLFPPQTLAPGALVQLTQATLGFGADAGDRLFLYGSGGDTLLDAVVAKGEPRGRWPDGTGRWCVPAALTPGASNQFVFHDEVVINEIMYHPPALPPTPAHYDTNVLIGIANTWKYHALGQDLGTAWRGAGYDDSGWPSAPALFYKTTSVLPGPKNTELPLLTQNGAPIVTYYFRTPFLCTGQPGGVQLALKPILDDGAVYYLNGVEIYRQNMPAGAIGYGTFSSVGVATPVYTGPFFVPVTNLLAGTNLFAVEVHQFTTNPIAADMAFGVEVSVMGQFTPAQTWRESPGSWVELFNRGAHAVDLTGWSLASGIDYRFDAGTTLGPGGYLVVAQDTGYMQSNYPGIAVVGPFDRRLSHSSDRLLLLDAAGNPADEVGYFDGGRWSEYADGGGSSLELRDPRSDNSRAEAWAASLEDRRSGWSNYTYTAIANNVLGPNVSGPTRWNELVIGLLDAGECLVDDVRVIESPDTAPVEMLQNGSFETGLSAWRVLGNHRSSGVITDPDNPSNHVLHLVATGPTDTMHNHLETTYAGDRSVVNGRKYQVSFRAKWLAGNNRLNTRLYFNRVARTTALPMPGHHGTPGAPNSVLTTNIGPTFCGLSHGPVMPEPGQPITVNVNAADPDGLGAVSLWWTRADGVWRSAAMLPNGAAAPPGYTGYSGVIPGQTAGTVVQFYVLAADGAGATSTFPARGPDSRALFKVDEPKGLMTQLHRLHLIMLPADADFLHAPTNVMSNERIGLTVIADEREVFYDVGVHLQGSQRGRNDSSRVGFTVRFNPDQLYRGVQGGFNIDRSGGYSGLAGRQDEILLWHAANHAGGVLGLECDLVQVLAPRSQEDGPGLLRMTAFDGDYFDSQFPNGGDGNRYTLELIYYPLTTVTGDPQSPKLPSPDEVINVEFQDYGDDPENYRWIFLQENRADIDDYSQVIALNKAFSLSGPAFETQTRQLIDVDEYLRTLAFKTLSGDVDTYTAGLNHNWKIYFRPGDGKAQGLLWDMDFCFYQKVDQPFPGEGSANTYRFLRLPDNYRRYYNHLLDLITTTFNSAHLSPWAAHYGGLLGQDWSAAANYLQQRANFIRGFLPLDTPFAITSNQGRNFATTNDHVTLTGTAPLTVKEIAINAVSYPLTWSTLTNWHLTVPLPAYLNVLSARGIDNYGQPLAGATGSITVTNLGALAPQPVLINEWMADNAGPSGVADPLDGRFQDWFELYNPNNVPIDLSGYSLTDSLSQPDRWRIPPNTVISPRGFLLVWADGEPDQNGLGTSGDLHADFQLSRGGEAIGLYAPDGTPQHTVVFGTQFQNLSQGLFTDGDTNAFYFMPDWTPRAPNRLGAPASPVVGAATILTNGAVSLRCQVITGRTYRIQYKDSLTATEWTTLGADQTAAANELTVVDNSPHQPQRFYRVVLLQ